MKLKAKLGTTKYAVVIIAAGYLLWGVAAYVFLAMPLLDILKFLLFQVLAVALPGIAIYKLFNLKLSPLEGLTLSYAFGIAALCAVYFLFAPFGAMDYIKYGVLALALGSIVVLVLKRGLSLSAKADEGEMRIALIVGAFALAASFITLSAANLDPLLAGARGYFHDTMNGVSLTVSASRSFPMTFLQMSGTEHRYHILYFAYGAIMKLCTNIDAFEVTTKLTLITISPLIAAAIACLAKKALKSNILTAVACVFAVVIPSGTSAMYLFRDTIGYPFGLAFAILTVLLFFKAEDTSSRKINRCHVASLICLLVTTGGKGPLAVTVLFGICFCLLLRLIREKDWSVILKGLLFAVPFVISYILLYGNGASDSMGIYPLFSATGTDFAQSIAGRLPAFLYYPLSILYYVFSLDYVIFICFIATIIYFIIAKKRYNILVDFTFGGLLIGYVLANIFKQMGSSEWYFIFVMAPFAVIALAYCVCSLLGICEKKWQRLLGFALTLGISAFIIVTNCILSFNSYYGDDYSTTVKQGVCAAIKYSRISDERILTNEQLAAAHDTDARRTFVTKGEYEGYLWIRDNTPEDSVIADSKYLVYNKCFTGSSFSERSFYLEGAGFVTMEDSNSNTEEKLRRESTLHFLYDFLDDGMCVILASEGCDYIIIDDYVTPDFSVREKYGTLVFENEDVKIYKLVKFD